MREGAEREVPVSVTVVITSLLSATLNGRAATAWRNPARFTSWILATPSSTGVPSTSDVGKGEPLYACTVASSSRTAL
jgi:hypothetical protein